MGLACRIIGRGPRRFAGLHSSGFATVTPRLDVARPILAPADTHRLRQNSVFGPTVDGPGGNVEPLGDTAVRLQMCCGGSLVGSGIGTVSIVNCHDSS
jgi:hypothetical protein